MANRGVSFDCVVGADVIDAVKAWCRRYSLQANVSFAYAKYSEEVASALALGWCQRVQMSRDVSVGSGDDATLSRPRTPRTWWSTLSSRQWPPRWRPTTPQQPV